MLEIYSQRKKNNTEHEVIGIQIEEPCQFKKGLGFI